ncbi:glycosyltransferase family 2 protein [Halobacillus trueperi]|uniref:glycosyltransferase family 2 protein n=1 Tax=Halobacillus trueperi TaxID=156205 RepID=UPI0037370A5F
MNPEISVIVPIYNVKRYLDACINSILNQTFSNIEIILVNDGSTDGSDEICDNYKNVDNRVKVVHKKNEGVSSARNRGVDESNGKYIGFIDPDDTIEENMYELLIKSIIKNNADVVLCPYIIHNEIFNTTLISTVYEENCGVVDRQGIDRDILPSILDGKYYSLLSCCNKLYKREVLMNMPFDENRNHGEDARLNILLLKQISKLVFIKQPLYNYFIRQRSSLTQIFMENFYDYLLDNRRFGNSLCIEYGKEDSITRINNDFVKATLFHMESAGQSGLPYRKIRFILNNIMNDNDFIENLVKYECPSFYYKILKWLSLHKNKNAFIAVVRAKENWKSRMKFVQGR